VIVAAVGLLILPSATWFDPASALVVAAIILYQASGVLRTSIAVLLESTPADVDLVELRSTMEQMPRVDEVHDLHVWSLSSEMRLLSAHVVLTGHPTLEEAQVVGERVKAMIADTFSIGHSTLELECEPCNDEDADPCRMEPVAQPAPAVRGARLD
jgi:cobalt-zinc-cadmium efflux system protein